jgi:hypothetical protein
MGDLIERLRRYAKTTVIYRAALEEAADALAARERELAEARRDGERLDELAAADREYDAARMSGEARNATAEEIARLNTAHFRRRAAIDAAIEQEMGNG